ncbi:hypothetical protein J3R30DRAFT_124784 [Lentinula aciculospora]|uniref:Uncharacterized protein n=1 Tax=Lentinula aciculospora TaxID=153920 RepID=A0A9W9DY26_9AGAR|nr:hypothetical protein J3R30DRAFT_124784 [Lentinula aciculospora]
MNNTNNGHSSTKTQSPRTSSTLTLSIGIGNTAPGFPSPSSSLVPPPVVVPTEFASVKDKRKDENSRKNSKVGLNGVTKSNSQLDTKLNLSSPAVDPEFMISPTTPTPDSLHRQRSFPNSESLSAAVASVIELPTDLLTDHEAHYSSTNSAVKAFSAAASGDTQSPIIPMPPFSKPSSSSSHSLPKTPVRTPSNPPTPSSPGFYFPPPTSSRKPNRDSTMSNFSTSSAASAHSTTSLKSNRPAPPSPALSRRTSGVGANATASPIAKRFSTGPGGGVSATGAIDRSHSLRTSPTVSRTHSNSPKAALPMSSHPHRFSSPAFRRDSSTMAVPAPLPLTPVPGSASLPPGSNPLPSSGLSSASLSSAGLSSAALRTATTASTGLTKGKSTGITSQMRRPIRIRDYAYMAGGGPQDLLALDALGDDDPRFLGLGTDGKGLHVPTPNRMKVLNKALLTATNMSAISSNLNATYTMWKMSYKRDRKERKAAAKRRAKDAKRERAHARYSMNSVRSSFRGFRR